MTFTYDDNGNILTDRVVRECKIQKPGIDIKVTQEFAKTPILGQTEKIRSSSFPQKKACILLHFFIIIPFKEKVISYHPLVITAAARNRLIVIGSNETRGFYADPYKTT